MKPSELIRRAGKNMNVRTWGQNIFIDNTCKVACAQGHLNLAMDGCPNRVFVEAIGYLEASLSQGLGEWNDTRGRTVMQVKTLFDRVATELEREGK
jgi:hypothetical protein